jgi:hypothetical protein
MTAGLGTRERFQRRNSKGRTPAVSFPCIPSFPSSDLCRVHSMYRFRPTPDCGTGSLSTERHRLHVSQERGRAPKARMRRCLKLRQGQSPLRPPAPFPSCPMFQNGPRHQGYAPENLFKTRKDFPLPRTNRAPLTAPGRSENLSVMRKRGRNAKSKTTPASGALRLPLVGPHSSSELPAANHSATQSVKDVPLQKCQGCLGT